MKQITIHIVKLSILFLVLTGCKKDDSLDNLSWDIHNAQEYYIYFKYMSTSQGTQHGLINFQSDNSVILQTTQYEITMPYTISANNTEILLGDGVITTNNGKITGITAPDVTYTDITVIKKSEVSIPLGKTFTGSYLRADGSVLHKDFYYKFISDNQYEAGIIHANIKRTETYEAIGNIGAWVINTSENNGKRELLLFINGILKVTYMEDQRKFYHGSFWEIK